MPPNLDIYGLTKYRDESTIGRFLDKYVDRLLSEDRKDEELMLVPLTHSKKAGDPNESEWEPARTLTHIVKRGLDQPRRAFTVYLAPKEATVDGVMLSFTKDDQLIVG